MCAMGWFRKSEKSTADKGSPAEPTSTGQAAAVPGGAAPQGGGQNQPVPKTTAAAVSATPGDAPTPSQAQAVAPGDTGQAAAAEASPPCAAAATQSVAPEADRATGAVPPSNQPAASAEKESGPAAGAPAAEMESKVDACGAPAPACAPQSDRAPAQNEPVALPSAPPAVSPAPGSSAETVRRGVVAPESAVDAGKRVETGLAQVESQLTGFQQRLDNHLADSKAFSEQAFKAMYAELQGYKNDFLLDAQLPLLKDLIMLYDSVQAFGKHCRKTGTVPVADLLANLDGFTVQIEEILARRGIERMDDPRTLDPHLHKPIKIVAASSEAEDKIVEEVVRSGFMLGDKPVRKAEVVVRRFQRNA